jgi:hypothetical protein
MGDVFWVNCLAVDLEIVCSRGSRGASAKTQEGDDQRHGHQNKVAGKAGIPNVEQGREASQKKALVQIRSFIRSTRSKKH